MKQIDKGTLITLLRTVSEGFETKSKIRLYSMGGTALTFLGLKDSTVDVDFLLEKEDDLRELRSAIMYARPSELGPVRFSPPREDGISVSFPKAGLRIDLYVGRVENVILSPNMIDRSKELESINWIELRTLSIPDLLLLKVTAGRPKDLEDVRAMSPTPEDWSVMVNEVLWQLRNSPSPRKLLYSILDSLSRWKYELPAPKRLFDVIAELYSISKPKKLVFIFSKASPAERTIRPLELLNKLRGMGIKVELVDTTGMSESQRFKLYMELAGLVAMKRKYEVRRVFGSRKNPGYLFGGMVPALVRAL